MTNSHHPDHERGACRAAEPPNGLELYPKESAIAGEIVMDAKHMATAETATPFRIPASGGHRALAAARTVFRWAIRAGEPQRRDKPRRRMQRLVVDDITIR